ncbi:MAG: bifunctional oligoribonuclease/PAP phosphatase NrnA [Acidobacteriaceae bacterium]
MISSHVRPDGDAIGSALGLCHLLEAMGKIVTVVFIDPIPPNFKFLAGRDRIACTFPAADAAIFLECDSLDRCSIDRSEYDAAPPALTINIDHHRSGREFADFNWIDPEAAAVGCMVYDLAAAAGIPISHAMADCLYAAILTDTGSFNYPSTTASTFAMAKHLVQSGTNPNRIASAVYFCNPASKVRLLGIALSNIQIEGAVSWSYVTLEEMNRVGATVEDCEGVANHLIGIAGVEAAVFVREAEERGQFRLSLRSRYKLDVSVIAERYGGGGHRNASGCSMEGTLADVIERIVGDLREACVPIVNGAEHVEAPTLPSILLA